MRKKLNLTLDSETYSYLKKSKKNVSSYVEKLVLKDILSRDVQSSPMARSSVFLFDKKYKGITHIYAYEWNYR